MCHRKIPKGQKYCDSCKQKRKNKADESYLDSLLTSVGINTSKKADPIPEPEPEEEYIPMEEQAYQEYDMPDNTAFAENTGNDINVGYDVSAGYDENSGFDVNAAVDENAGTASENPEMDDMLSDLLDDMESAGMDQPSPEPDIGEDDLENIFDEAEAYATLLNKDENPDNPQTVNEGDSIGATPESSEPEDDGLLDVEWKNDGEETGNGDNGFQGIDSEMDALFEEVDANLSDGYDNVPEDEQLNSVDESLHGENPEQVSAKEAFSNFDPIEESISTPEKKKKKKLSWFKRLFGNTNDEVTPEMIEADRLKKEEEEKQAQLDKEEKKKKAEAKKAADEAEKARKKAEADAERNRKMALAAEKKAAAKEKERKKKETALAIAEYEMEHGKINKAGATILFIIFAILTIVIIIGTNIYSYNLSIKNAQEDFDIKKYNEAYYEVYGLKIQDEDIELYDKIMTVMYVNNQLNSYENYMRSDNKEKALDSLVKGLQRYDKYHQLAQRLNITNDLDYVKGKILNKLAEEFNMTETEARKLMTNDDAVDYSEYLYALLGSYEDL